MSTPRDDTKADAPHNQQADGERPSVAGAVELTEDSLDTVVGGRKAGGGQKDFLKVTMKEVFITS